MILDCGGVNGWFQQNLHSGASMVKWTTHDPYPMLSESDSKLYTAFKFCEETNHKHFKNMLIYKNKQFMMTKTILREAYIF